MPICHYMIIIVVFCDRI